jgi:hypothetical protein
MTGFSGGNFPNYPKYRTRHTGSLDENKPETVNYYSKAAIFYKKLGATRIR